MVVAFPELPIRPKSLILDSHSQLDPVVRRVNQILLRP
jgi:hypothetical protein